MNSVPSKKRKRKNSPSASEGKSSVRKKGTGGTGGWMGQEDDDLAEGGMMGGYMPHDHNV
ncbi:MAG: hypothetical protein KJ718_05675 [Nanoarchaeota archaeon]|nr:hypothetical protein [Nanoarchaeota archaeon]MBU1052012.1 hypothetical protein [Nanoarchaeota archaeon]MBU1988001.1 hypothetical protein [Nanoarchaeota archaeon]